MSKCKHGNNKTTCLLCESERKNGNGVIRTVLNSAGTSCKIPVAGILVGSILPALVSLIAGKKNK